MSKSISCSPDAVVVYYSKQKGAFFVYRILLALQEEALGDALVHSLGDQYHTTVCNDGITALKLLEQNDFDMLILDLLLPKLDGFSILLNLGSKRPDIIIAISAHLNNLTVQRGWDLGISAFLPKPSRVSAIIQNLEHIRLVWEHASDKIRDPQYMTAVHLRRLSLSEHLDGFHHLRVGTPLYAADPTQSLTKELYPHIAKLCGNGDGKQVEHSIRQLINGSWNNRDKAVWQKYFGNCPQRPSNKKVFANLARVLEEDMWEDF